MFQSTTVSWSVDRGSSTMDLLTLDNMTFSGDPRFSVVFQNPTNWALGNRQYSNFIDLKHAKRVKVFNDRVNI